MAALADRIGLTSAFAVISVALIISSNVVGNVL